MEIAIHSRDGKKLMPTFCFICGVDSTEIRNFLIAVIGSLVFASFCIWLWSLLSGRLSGGEDMSSFAIQADKKDEA